MRYEAIKTGSGVWYVRDNVTKALYPFRTKRAAEASADAKNARTDRLSVEIPAYGVGETLRLFVLAGTEDRVRTLAGRCAYGERYSRAVVETSVSTSYAVRDGYPDLPERYLAEAEEIASR